MVPQERPPATNLSLPGGAINLGQTSDRIGGGSIWFTDDLGPAVFGLLQPRVILPTWLRELPSDQLDLVLLHEREHIRSRDTWALALTVLLRLALPWHVGLWYLTRGPAPGPGDRLRQTRRPRRRERGALRRDRFGRRREGALGNPGTSAHIR